MNDFLEWLAKGDVVLAYWNPQRGELMPILYTADDLVANFAAKRAPISGKVKRAK